MAIRARLTILVVVTAMLAACGGAPTPTPAEPGPTPTPTPAPSAAVQEPTDPCGVAVTHVGALSERLAGDLVALRELVVAASFDGPEAAARIRKVSATLTSYVGLEQTLASCEATTGLGPRVGQLRTTAEATLAGSVSATIADEQVHWDAAVGLVGLLDDVLALSGDAKDVADSLGFDIAIATDPGGTAGPGASPPAGTSWPELRAWSKTFWPLVTGHVAKIRTATAQRKAKVIDTEAAKLAAVVATGNGWLGRSEPWPCYRGYRRLTDDAIATYGDAAAAYAANKDASGTYLLKKADGMLAKLNAMKVDRLEVRCRLDPAAPA